MPAPLVQGAGSTTGRLVVSCLSCTKVDLLLYAQCTWPETLVMMMLAAPYLAQPGPE